MLRRLVVALLIVGMLVPLAACGRRGALEPPPDGTYSRQYPTQ